LLKKGYRVRYVEFSTGLEANNAVFKGEIDANVMQHTIFLNSYNERQKTDLVGIVHVPTPPMGLYSKKHPLGTPIKPGATVAVPNDPVNLQRELWILRDLGLIEIRDRSTSPSSTSSRTRAASRSCRWRPRKRRGRLTMSISPPFREILRSTAV
jgi:ABC-type metal ion transport system substrate-binding protein